MNINSFWVWNSKYQGWLSRFLISKLYPLCICLDPWARGKMNLCLKMPNMRYFLPLCFLLGSLCNIILLHSLPRSKVPTWLKIYDNTCCIRYNLRIWIKSNLSCYCPPYICFYYSPETQLADTILIISGSLVLTTPAACIWNYPR